MLYIFNTSSINYAATLHTLIFGLQNKLLLGVELLGPHNLSL
jgi:hypothetical protein